MWVAVGGLPPMGWIDPSPQFTIHELILSGPGSPPAYSCNVNGLPDATVVVAGLIATCGGTLVIRSCRAIIVGHAHGDSLHRRAIQPDRAEMIGVARPGGFEGDAIEIRVPFHFGNDPVRIGPAARQLRRPTFRNAIDRLTDMRRG